MTTIPWQQYKQQADEANTVVPPGQYPAQLVAATATTTGTSKPAVSTLFQVNGGPYAGKQIPNLFTLTVDNPNAMGIFFKQMDQLGVPASFFTQEQSMEALAQMLVQVARPVLLTITHRDWQGQARTNIDKIEPMAGAQAAPPPVQAPAVPAATAVPAAPPPPAPAPVQQQVPVPVPVPVPAPVPAPAPAPAPVPQNGPPAVPPAAPAPPPASAPVAPASSDEPPF